MFKVKIIILYFEGERDRKNGSTEIIAYTLCSISTFMTLSANPVWTNEIRMKVQK